MEDYQIDIMIDSGPNVRSVQIKINPFTLIGGYKVRFVNHPIKEMLDLGLTLDLSTIKSHYFQI